MEYDHHTKAGNQGDVAKHPALIAALDGVLKQETNARGEATSSPFSYLDIFAGHPWHPLLDEDEVPDIQKRFEWKQGIGALHEKLWAAGTLNPAVTKWRDWYVPRRELVRGWYPGSSVIAADIVNDTLPRYQ